MVVEVGVFKGIKAWLKYLLYPSLPYQVLEVVFPDRVETFYDGYDEIVVNSTGKGYVISITPREPRSDAPGPLTFLSSHDPWSVGILITPFYIFRKEVMTWILLWFMIIYNLFIFGFNYLYTPPSIEVYIPAFNRNMTIPDPMWKPDPIVISYWIVMLGLLTSYYLFHVLRFITPTVKISTLISIGAVSGAYYVIPGPEPLTVIKSGDFLKLLGYKFYHFSIDVVHQLIGVVNSLLKENRTLREQALSYDDALSRTHQIDVMLKRFSASEVVGRFMMTKPLLFLLMITLPLLLGMFIGMMVGGGISVQPASGNTTTTITP